MSVRRASLVYHVNAKILRRDRGELVLAFRIGNSNVWQIERRPLASYTAR